MGIRHSPETGGLSGLSYLRQGFGHLMTKVGEIVFWKDNGQAIARHPACSEKTRFFSARKYISWTLAVVSSFGVCYFEVFCFGYRQNAIAQSQIIALTCYNSNGEFCCGVIERSASKNAAEGGRAVPIAGECVFNRLLIGIN